MNAKPESLLFEEKIESHSVRQLLRGILIIVEETIVLKTSLHFPLFPCYLYYKLDKGNTSFFLSFFAVTVPDPLSKKQKQIQLYKLYTSNLN